MSRQSNYGLTVTINLFSSINSRYIVKIVVTENQPYQERSNTWCWSVPPRCSKYKIKFRTVNKTQELTKTRVIKECCEGYGKNKAGDRCIPICTKGCKHGDCVAPEQCKCESGYGGPSCDLSELLGLE